MFLVPLVLVFPLVGPFVVTVVPGYNDLLTPLGFFPVADAVLVVFVEALLLALLALLVPVCL